MEEFEKKYKPVSTTNMTHFATRGVSSDSANGGVASAGRTINSLMNTFAIENGGKAVRVKFLLTGAELDGEDTILRGRMSMLESERVFKTGQRMIYVKCKMPGKKQLSGLMDRYWTGLFYGFAVSSGGTSATVFLRDPKMIAAPVINGTTPALPSPQFTEEELSEDPTNNKYQIGNFHVSKQEYLRRISHGCAMCGDPIPPNYYEYLGWTYTSDPVCPACIDSAEDEGFLQLPAPTNPAV